MMKPRNGSLLIRRLASLTASVAGSLAASVAGSLAAALAFTGCAPPPNEAMARAQHLLHDEIRASRIPGVQYLVVDRDSILFEHNEGFADVSASAPVTSSSRFSIYSMTKTFTAAAALQLVDSGAIGLEQSAKSWLPELPYGEAVKIKHLLAQTSGIPDPIPLRWAHLESEHATFDEAAALRKVMTEHSELDFAPGESYGYSNISYWILGKIVEKASGMSFTSYVETRLLDPLGLAERDASFDLRGSPDQVEGYVSRFTWLNLLKGLFMDDKFVGGTEDAWVRIKPHYLDGPAFGGLNATARAIGVFLQDQLRESSAVLSPAARALFYRRQRTSSGDAVDMTLGWHVGELSGVRYYFKEGGGAGGHVEMRLYPDAGFATVLLANSGSFSTRTFLSRLDRPWIRIRKEEN